MLLMLRVIFVKTFYLVNYNSKKWARVFLRSSLFCFLQVGLCTLRLDHLKRPLYYWLEKTWLGQAHYLFIVAVSITKRSLYNTNTCSQFYIIRNFFRYLAHGKYFQPSLIFASKVGAKSKVVNFRCSTLGWAPGLTCNYSTKVEKVAVTKPPWLILPLGQRRSKTG